MNAFCNLRPNIDGDRFYTSKANAIRSLRPSTRVGVIAFLRTICTPTHCLVRTNSQLYAASRSPLKRPHDPRRNVQLPDRRPTFHF